jgi:hypothetical protein
MRCRSPYAHGLVGLALGAVAASAPARARADEAQAAEPSAAPEGLGPATRSLRLLGSLAFGTGFRFNNPYRLRTELGSGGESVSMTPGYLDLGAGALFGPPSAGQAGFALHLSTALAGVRQNVLTPSVVGSYRASPTIGLFASAGAPNLLGPDFNVGGELGLGAAYYLTSGIALRGDLYGDLFVGAGTREVRAAVYPIVSGQLGVLVDWEVLP